jgi:hypothetical protein
MNRHERRAQKAQKAQTANKDSTSLTRPADF